MRYIFNQGLRGGSLDAGPREKDQQKGERKEGAHKRFHLLLLMAGSEGGRSAGSPSMLEVADKKAPSCGVLLAGAPAVRGAGGLPDFHIID